MTSCKCIETSNIILHLPFYIDQPLLIQAQKTLPTSVNRLGQIVVMIKNTPRHVTSPVESRFKTEHL